MKVVIPTPLRSYTNQREVEAKGGTLFEVLADLDRQFPGIRFRVVDEQGNEIDPRQELIDKLLEYKRYKEAAATLAEMEAIRHLMVRRGNLQKDLSQIGEDAVIAVDVWRS